MNQFLSVESSTDYIKKNARIIEFRPVIEFSKKFINQLWNLEMVNREFLKGINLIQKHSSLIKNDPEQAFISMMETGNSIVKLLFTDPLLPELFYPKHW